MRRRTGLGLGCGLGAGLLLALLVPRASGALSFTLPAGATINDIDMSSSAQDLTYDGTSEVLTLTADVDVFRLTLSGGGTATVELDPGQVRFSMNIALDGTVDASTTALSASFRNGVNADFTVWDLGADGDSSDDLLFAADFDDGLAFNAQDFFGLISASVGEASYQVVGSQAPSFLAALPSSGTLFSSLDQIQRNGSTIGSLCDIVDDPCPSSTAPGFEDFSAQPTLDLTPLAAVPEPGMGMLLGAGLAAALARGRSRRS